MIKIEIKGDVFQVLGESSQDNACLKCYFCTICCPLSDNWPYNALCDDYDGYAYFKRIK